MIIDLIVTWTWTLLSGLFVGLAVYGIVISNQEDRDTAAELQAQRSRTTPNGIPVLALQQASQARFLKVMHRLAFVHQSAGLLIGVLSLWNLYYGNPDINTPTTQIEQYREWFVLSGFMILLLCVCGVQFYLIRVTWGQRKARMDLRALEMEDDDRLKKVVEEIAQRMKSLDERDVARDSARDAGRDPTRDAARDRAHDEWENDTQQ